MEEDWNRPERKLTERWRRCSVRPLTHKEKKRSCLCYETKFLCWFFLFVFCCRCWCSRRGVPATGTAAWKGTGHWPPGSTNGEAQKEKHECTKKKNMRRKRAVAPQKLGKNDAPTQKTTFLMLANGGSEFFFVFFTEFRWENLSAASLAGRATKGKVGGERRRRGRGPRRRRWRSRRRWWRWGRGGREEEGHGATRTGRWKCTQVPEALKENILDILRRKVETR